MKVIHRNTELPIELLKPHPDNPRKDVGDVTELAESIKANGIFQNLTVLKGDALDGYTVLIGHRRLAAAKLAGLELVPCMVVDMDKREQVSTMLLENMQRNDLTVWEQAQGFQMMIDLGDTEEGICEKTGFSKTTVRHRLKLLELDPEEFKKSQEKGVTLDDYIKLEKISDTKAKNDALKKIGSPNFNWTVESVVREEKQKKNKEEWNKWLESRLEKVSYEWGKRERLGNSYFDIKSELTDEKKAEIEKLIEIEKETSPNKPEVYYMQDSYGYTYIVGREKEDTQKAREEESRAKQELYRRRKERIEPIEEQAQKLREQFIADYQGGKNSLKTIVTMYLTSPEVMNYGEADYEALADRMGLSDVFSVESDDYNDNAEPVDLLIKNEGYLKKIEQRPDKAMLYLLANVYEGGNYACCHDYFGVHQKSEELEWWYEQLSKLGYQISDDERALLDGTHECFKEAE